MIEDSAIVGTVLFDNPLTRAPGSLSRCPDPSILLDHPFCSGAKGARAYYMSRSYSRGCQLPSSLDAVFSDLSGKAAFDIGDKYYFGSGGVVRDYAAALAWYQRAGNYGPAIYALGYMYENGLGAAKNIAISVMYYKRAIGAGEFGGACSVGLAFESGNGEIQNFSQAMHYYTLGAQHDLPTCMYDIGVMNHLGEGVPVDTRLALQWYRKAIALARAQNNAEIVRLASQNAANITGSNFGNSSSYNYQPPANPYDVCAATGCRQSQ